MHRSLMAGAIVIFRNMKKQDIYFILGVIILFAPFFLSSELFRLYREINHQHGMVMSFFKFAILATMGEVIGLRIKTGKYNQPGFGILPRAIVWGLLGFTIQMAFVIFSTGAPIFLAYLGLEGAATAMADTRFTMERILAAFTISVTMNLIYAPVMMTLHKITDTHIEHNGGSMRALIKPISMGKIMAGINWHVQWDFVFKKTIPFFWIPAHTITFLLPAEYRVLFAAVLGIMLGVLLAIAAIRNKNCKREN
jgi:hypothetical protein